MKNPLLKNQDGMVMLTSLMFLVILFIVATTAYLITSNDLKIGGNYKTSKQAFYVAEAGIEHAIGVLKDADVDFDAVLQGGGILSFGSSVSFAGGTYQVVVTDNDDDVAAGESSEDYTTDRDKKVYITSTGAKDGATSRIQVLFWGNHLDVAVDGALAIYGDGPGVELGAGAGGPSTIDGRDHDVPAAFKCSGANCEGSLNGEPANTGVYSEEELSPDDFYTAPKPPPQPQDQNIFGSPPVDEDGGGAGTLTDWLNLATTAVPDIVLNGNQTLAGNVSYGTREDPKITVINGDVDIHGSGTIDGAGILIVNGDFRITGTLHWEGIILVTSTADLSVEATGRVTLLGAVVLAGSGASAEVALNGHASINYSSKALEYAGSAMDNAQVVSWENQYN